MEPPYVELDLTGPQFEVLISIMNSIRAQRLNNQSGEIEFAELVHLSWNSNGVRLEMRANHD